jgi:S-adenosylhomocysteine hydrolase
MEYVFGTRLPLLQFAAEHYPSARLDRSTVIACQHILPTTFALFDELFKKGLEPHNVFLLGKCYSTNQDTFQRFKDIGVNISDESLAFDSHRTFDEQYQEYVDRFLQSARSKIDITAISQTIILDDGGYLISSVNGFYDSFSNVSAVEQTSSGYERLKRLTLRIPVVNVARSKVKLEIESPFIAEVVVEKLGLYVEAYKVDDPKVLIIGNGYIGVAIANLLKDVYVVSSCDILADRRDFGGRYKDYLGEYDVIIGATGTTIIRPIDFGVLRPGVLLASASSSDREFSATDLRKRKTKTDDCHADITIDNVTVLNSGFPINFDGKDGVSAEKIQLTRSLLLAGVLEAATKDLKAGLLDLNPAIQDQLTKEFSRLSK